MAVEVKELLLNAQVALDDRTASPELVEIIQRLVLAVRDLEDRVYAIENP